MIGTKLAHYEITSHLGSGGMGDVYQATDSKLRRSVAVKFLPEAFARDADRVTRFEREARVLASLNHPNIAAIYGLEDADGKKFLVMELVAGETLAERIQRGPIPVEEALGIAKQIAEALEAAHEKGIIHRDLKPANVKMTPDRKVKVLDFGLAKAYQQDAANANLSNSPTMVSIAATQQGVILGTAAYMSPEQAKGFEADARSDVFSFGCVLYEMLAGRQAFAGDTAADVLAAVLARDPDLAALPANLNPRITDMLRRCIEKNPKRRWHAVADIRVEIEAILADPRGLLIQAQTATLQRPLWKRAIPVALAFIIGTALGATVLWTITQSPSTAVTRFPFTVPEGQQFTNVGRQLLSIAPDGSQFVYVANQRLFVKPMRELSSIFIQGTAIPEGVLNPVFSPDSRSLIFWSAADQTIKRIAVSGGAPVTVGRVATPFGMAWGPDNWILVGQGNQGIVRVSANGGRPETIVSLKQNELAHGPQILPGGNAVLFTLAKAAAGGADRWDTAQIVAQSLKSGERKVLIEGGSDARYLPTGYLIYVLSGTLLAVPFDVKRLAVTGAPVPIVEGIRSAGGNTGTSQFSVSDNGSLIYVPGPAGTPTNQLHIALVDRNGKVEPLKTPPGPYAYPRISPDGKQVAFESDDGKQASIWIYELSGATSMRRLTFGGNNRFPLWSADGQRIVFQSDLEGDLGIFWQRADGLGAAERLTKAEQGESHVPESWPAKGDRFSFSVVKGSTVSLSTFSLKDKKVVPVEGIQSSALINSVFSPDGRWLAYYTSTRGGDGIFVQPFPPTGAKIQIGDGVGPVWSRDGKYLYWHPRGSGQFAAATITTQPVFAFENPARTPMGGLRLPATGHTTYDVMPDGKQFIGLTAAQETQSATTTPQIQIVINWFQDLKQRVAVH